MGHPKDFLESRAVIKCGQYAVLPPGGRVINAIPGFEGFQTTILTSPKMGAQSVFYISTVEPGAKNTLPFGGNGVETFVYYLDGEGALTVKAGEESFEITQGGYAFVPADKEMELFNKSEGEYRIILYKQKYIEIEGYNAEIVVGNVNDIEEREYDGMDDMLIKDLLPIHLGFDMNMHILSFKPAGSHPFIETHVQEHSAYIIEGQGYYQLGDEWIQVKKDDFLWMAPFVQQGCYATGRTRFTYIYSKDCNRDEKI